jgi:hypothetical protein
MTDDERRSDDEAVTATPPPEPRPLPPPEIDEETEAIDRDTERAAEGPITESSSLDSRS